MHFRVLSDQPLRLHVLGRTIFSEHVADQLRTEYLFSPLGKETAPLFAFLRSQQFEISPQQSQLLAIGECWSNVEQPLKDEQLSQESHLADMQSDVRLPDDL